MPRLIAFCLAALLLSSLPASAQSVRWVPGQGQTCFAVCDREGAKPVISGIFTPNGQPYTVCRAHFGGEGARPGYNLQPNWAHACFSAQGGVERQNSRFDCLCQRDRDRSRRW